MSAEKLTKAQRAKIVPEPIREALIAMPDQVLLAVHDLCHAEMERRHGTNKRPAAGRLDLASADQKETQV